MDELIEQRIAEMSEAEFTELVARTRPPTVTDPKTPAEWRASFQAKTAKLTELMNPTKGT